MKSLCCFLWCGSYVTITIADYKETTSSHLEIKEEKKIHKKQENLEILTVRGYLPRAIWKKNNSLLNTLKC
ncbi:unnamed protein product [Clavelina lepadiformis]|uniref:Uncharacterized protein n=1 Tax=Clavelina lepadiformis TaxID=159417 RepID=A0ABP0GB74_CLALP